MGSMHSCMVWGGLSIPQFNICFHFWFTIHYFIWFNNMAYPSEFYRPNGLEAYQAQAFKTQIILLILRRKNGRIVTTNDK
jgi:hypothetical protein